MHLKLAWWIPLGVLSVALLQLPYWYYLFVRLIVCGACIFLTRAEVEAHRTRWAWTLGAVAFLYNPLIKVHLDRELWWIINLATIWLLAIHMWARRPTHDQG